MNTMCAAGTGSFLDQQARRIGVSIEKEFGELALRSQNPPHIAGRCSVFAKSDMIHLQQIATPVARHRGRAVLRGGPQLQQQPGPGPGPRKAGRLPGRRGGERRGGAGLPGGARTWPTGSSSSPSTTPPWAPSARSSTSWTSPPTGTAPSRGWPAWKSTWPTRSATCRTWEPLERPCAARAQGRRVPARARREAGRLPRHRRGLPEHQRGAHRRRDQRGGPALPAHGLAGRWRRSGGAWRRSARRWASRSRSRRWAPPARAAT